MNSPNQSICLTSNLCLVEKFLAQLQNARVYLFLITISFFSINSKAGCTRIDIQQIGEQAALGDNEITADNVHPIVANSFKNICGGPVPVIGSNLRKTEVKTNMLIDYFIVLNNLSYTSERFVFTTPSEYSPTITKADLGGCMIEFCFDLLNGIGPQQFFVFTNELTPVEYFASNDLIDLLAMNGLNLSVNDSNSWIDKGEGNTSIPLSNPF